MGVSITSSIFLLLAELGVHTSNVSAQIVPDATLGSERSQVIPRQVQGVDRLSIEGGAQKGQNLFHSFSDFNVGNGARVYFAKPSGVSNILSRVTGPNASQILGKLGVEGTANLFLINPNGITFGVNSTLDIRGSFTASTAESFTFPGGETFSAVTPDVAPEVTIAVPVGLQMGVRSQGITSVGRLEVEKDLELVGKDLFLMGSLTAYRDLVLKSYNPIIISSNLLSGRDIKLEQVSTKYGNSVSPFGLNIQSYGDVVMGDYVGKSLQILAGRNVKTGNIKITGPNINNLTQESNILISDNTLISLNANQFSIFDVRAGILFDHTTYRKSIDSSPDRLVLPSSSIGRIDIGKVEILSSGGTIYIANNYYPRADKYNASINIGDILTSSSLRSLPLSQKNRPSGLVVIDGSHNIFTSSIDIGGKNPNQTYKSLGILLISSMGGIDTRKGEIVYGSVGNTSNIYFSAFGDINTSSISSRQGPSGFGGSISLISHNGSIDTTGGSISATGGSGVGGEIILKSKYNISTSSLSSSSLKGSGDISLFSEIGDIDTSSGSIKTGSYNTGNVRLVAGGNIILGSIFTQAVPPYAVIKNKLTKKQNAGFQAGSIYISGKSILMNKSQVTSSAEFNYTQAGKIDLLASNSITIFGSSKGENPSGIFSISGVGASEDAGVINIETKRLYISDFANISTSSLSDFGNGGTIKINADSVEVVNGSKIIASTSGKGDGGDIIINVLSNLRVDSSKSGIFAFTDILSSGKAGDIIINKLNGQVGRIQVQNQAGISATSLGSGAGGNIQIQSKNISLENRAFLSAETTSNSGGGIALDIGNILLMRRGSSISTTAGTAGTSGAIGKGGDININARFIIAPPYENSDIKANAFNGEGGRVNINSEKVFGMFIRSRSDLIRLLGSSDPKDLDPIRLSTSDITAISQNNPTLNGSVEVSQLEVDPTRGLNAEPLRPQKPNVSEDCGSQNQSRGSRVTSSGRGGITPTPSDSLTGSMIWQDPNQPIASSLPAENTITIAQGWVQKSNGTVLLVGSKSPSSTTPACHVR